MRKELSALREAMAKRGIDAYVIPTDDFHGSEYVGAYFMCRKFVSGFTGSAGTLVVTSDWAGLWTDGRYFLQGAQQLEGSGIALCKMGESGVPTVMAWLADYMTDQKVLGFDGRTMMAQTGLEFEKEAERCGAKIIYDLDLVGEICAERHAMSKAPSWELEVTYAGRTRKEKLASLWKDIQNAGADCHILTSLDDLCWLLNIRGDDVKCCPVVLGFLYMDAKKVVFYTDKEKFSLELQKRLEADGVVFKPYLEIFTDVKEIPTSATVLLDPTKLNYALLKNLRAKRLEQTNPTERPKGTKTPEESSHIRKAHVKDGVALTGFMRWLKSHVGREPLTEISAAQKLEEFRSRQEGYLGPSFAPIFGYGPHGAIVHYTATPESDAALEAHGFVLADTGGHYIDGSTDVTRTFVLGSLTQAMRHHYTLVLRGNLNLAAAKFKSGCSGASLDYLARKPLWDEGLDYNHGTGHGVGYLLAIHEGPQRYRYQAGASNRGRAPMETRMVTSDEPGIYLTDQYGIRLENLMLCVETQKTEFGTFLGFETLTMCPFELEAIVPEEMTVEEIQLLNADPETVYQTLSPYFTDEEKQWLRHATRPI